MQNPPFVTYATDRNIHKTRDRLIQYKNYLLDYYVAGGGFELIFLVIPMYLGKTRPSSPMLQTEIFIKPAIA
jgi:hypothetical protein